MEGAHEARCRDISVILPVYNEAACLEATIREAAAVVTGLQGWRSEVIAVDDGSTDGTSDILRRLAGELAVLRLTRNSGQSAAFHAGFRAARGAVLVTMDADGQNDPPIFRGCWKSYRAATCVAVCASSGGTRSAAGWRAGSATGCATR